MDDDLYQSWKKRQARADVSPDFVDRVLTSIRAYERQPRQRPPLILLLLAPRPVRWTAVGLAIVAGAVRVGAALALFLFPS